MIQVCYGFSFRLSMLCGAENQHHFHEASGFLFFARVFFHSKTFFVVLFSHTLTVFFGDFPFSFMDSKHISESIIWNWKIFLENSLWEKRIQSVRLQIHDQTQYEYLMLKSYEIRWIISIHKQYHQLWPMKEILQFLCSLPSLKSSYKTWIMNTHSST